MSGPGINHWIALSLWLQHLANDNCAHTNKECIPAADFAFLRLDELIIKEVLCIERQTLHFLLQALLQCFRARADQQRTFQV